MRKKRPSFTGMSTGLIVGTVILFTALIFVVFVTMYESAMRKSAVVSVEQAVSQTQATVEKYVEDLFDTTRNFRDVFKSPDETMEAKIRMMLELKPEVVLAACYDKKGNAIHMYSNKNVKKSVFKNLSYEDWDAYNDGNLHISEPHVESLIENEYPWVVSIAQNIVTSNMEPQTVVIDIQFSDISQYIDGVGVGQHGYCFIVDDGGKIVYHPQLRLLYSELKRENVHMLSAGRMGTHVENKQIYSINPVGTGKWRVVGVSYIDELVTANLRTLIGILILWIIIVVLIATVCSMVLSRHLSKPINELIYAMQSFENDAENFSYKATAEMEEIHALSLSFGHMVTQIQELMEKVRNEEITLRKTELKALQAQINPHFLYNTLDAICWLCEADRSKDAAQMVNALAKLFRISISKGHELIPIEKEVEHAKCYLMIEKIRYKNQFTYRFEVQDSCRNYLCNKITLQPIIENAIYHGLNRMVDEGEIVIRIFEESDNIVFEVSDNGVGMTAAQCAEILNYEQGGKSGIGIKNVNDRIKIYFGENYGLTIESEPDEGTRVTITMPKVVDEK